MRVITALFLIVFIHIDGSAQLLDPRENFLSDGLSFVPPNCLTNPFPGPSGNVITSDVGFPTTGDVNGPTTIVRLNIWRVRCPESNRSSVMVRFINLSGNLLEAPALGPILISAGPDDFAGGILRPFANDASFVEQVTIQADWLSNGGVSEAYQLNYTNFPEGPPSTLDADEYQQSLDITFFGFDNNGNLLPFLSVNTLSIDDANGNQQFPLPPLTGRHNGNWVVQDTSDQGILVSVGELPNRELVLFIAWFTYGPSGEQAWYTGNALFSIGDNSVTFNLTRGMGGEFQGNTPANRETVGTATLAVSSCAELIFDFDLSSIGQGTGSSILQRLFAGETAGYVCRDLDSRLSELNGG